MKHLSLISISIISSQSKLTSNKRDIIGNYREYLFHILFGKLAIVKIEYAFSCFSIAGIDAAITIECKDANLIATGKIMNSIWQNPTES